MVHLTTLATVFFSPCSQVCDTTFATRTRTFHTTRSALARHLTIVEVLIHMLEGLHFLLVLFGSSQAAECAQVSATVLAV